MLVEHQQGYAIFWTTALQISTTFDTNSGPLGLAVERDLYFELGPWSEVKARH